MKKIVLWSLLLTTLGLQAAERSNLRTLPADVQFEIVMQMIDDIQDEKSLLEARKSIASLKETSREFANLLDNEARRKTLLKKLGEQAQDFMNLFDAINNNDVLIVDALISAGADPNAQNKEGVVPLVPLYLAVALNKLKIAEILINNGADVNVRIKNSTLIELAVRNNSADLARLLLDKDATNINQIDIYGSPLLVRALESGAYNVVPVLIEYGADVNKEEIYKGITPLRLAARSGELELMRLLIEKGADLNKADNVGITPLRSAIKNMQAEAALLLIDKGAHMNKTAWSELKHSNMPDKDKVKIEAALKAKGYESPAL